jgi:hypothetical protein
MQRVSSKPNSLRPLQKTILRYFISFRFLTSKQLTLLLGYAHRTNARRLLRELELKNTIQVVSSIHASYAPKIYCLSPDAKPYITALTNYPPYYVRWLYKEKSKSPTFVRHHEVLLGTFLYYRNKPLGKNIQQLFLTTYDMGGLPFIKDSKADALIKESDGVTITYTLIYIVDPGLSRQKKYYLVSTISDYYYDQNWQGHMTGDFPRVLFICPSKGIVEKLKKIVNESELDDDQLHIMFSLYQDFRIT